MGFFDMFRGAKPVAARADLVDFLDAQAAFLGQKGVFEYSRARAGPTANVLFRDPSFLAELELARWRVYPVALAMVGEMVEGALRPAAGEQVDVLQQSLIEAATAVLDRHAALQSLPVAEWEAARGALLTDLAQVSLHPVKRVMDIPARFLDRYVACMPIHEKLRGKDAPTIHNYLKANLCNMHDVFMRRAKLPALVEDMIAAR